MSPPPSHGEYGLTAPICEAWVQKDAANVSGIIYNIAPACSPTGGFLQNMPAFGGSAMLPGRALPFLQQCHSIRYGTLTHD
ncbi:MAG: hypothetical protein ACYDHM_12915 [Acidiferrobacterales bacterium]